MWITAYLITAVVVAFLTWHMSHHIQSFERPTDTARGYWSIVAGAIWPVILLGLVQVAGNPPRHPPAAARPGRACATRSGAGLGPRCPLLIRADPSTCRSGWGSFSRCSPEALRPGVASAIIDRMVRAKAVGLALLAAAAISVGTAATASADDSGSGLL